MSAITNENQSELNKALINAFEENSYKRVMDALYAGADIFAKNSKGKRFWIKEKKNWLKILVFFKGAEKALKPSIELANEAYLGNTVKVKKLLKNNKFSESALTRALMETARRYDNDSNYVEGSHEKICELLLERGANPHFSFEGKTGETAYSIAQDISDSMKTFFLRYEEKQVEEEEKQLEDVLENLYKLGKVEKPEDYQNKLVAAFRNKKEKKDITPKSEIPLSILIGGMETILKHRHYDKPKTEPTESSRPKNEVKKRSPKKRQGRSI